MMFTARCKLSTDCLPQAPYRVQLEALHADMLAEIEHLHRWKSTHAPRIEALAPRIEALAQRIEALEGLLQKAWRDAEAGREAIVSLASERAANAALTAELEASEQRYAEDCGFPFGEEFLRAGMEAECEAAEQREAGLGACPSCGVVAGYALANGSTYRWWTVACANCGAEMGECAADRTLPAGAAKPARWKWADEHWNRMARMIEQSDGMNP